jgi:hypothetical protein
MRRFPPQLEATMSVCDVCNASTSFAEGTTYTATDFRRLVSRGFQPPASMFALTAAFGMSQREALEGWKNTIVATSETDWLLCPSCAAKAKQY